MTPKQQLYEEKVNHRKVKRNKTCKFHKGAHVFSLIKEKEVLFIKTEKKLGEYRCNCGKKKVIFEKYLPTYL